MAWGLWVALYIFFVEMAAGIHIFSSLAIVFEWKPFSRIARIAVLASVLSLMAGLSFVWIDLGHPERMWELIWRNQPTSVMAVLVWVYLAFFLLLLTHLAVATRPVWLPALGRSYRPEDAESDKRLIRTLALVGIPVAIAVSSGVGSLVGAPGARIFWQVGLYPVNFLVTALATGAAALALMTVLLLPRGDPERSSLIAILRWMVLVGVVAEFMFIFFDYFVSLYGGVPANVDAVQEIIAGPYGWSFWIIQVAIGMALPFLVLMHPRLSTRPFWLGLAGLAVLVGFVAVRLNALLPAFAVPAFEGLEEAFFEPRLTYEYFPTVTEWLVALLIPTVLLGAFYAGYRALPLMGRDPGEAPANPGQQPADSTGQ
jgi:molybdopterin-containing oxidoreductase family membrane subunit